jgi:hypothetical protein
VTKVKVTFANGAIRSAKAKTVEAAIAKLRKYADGSAIVNVAVKGTA